MPHRTLIFWVVFLTLLTSSHNLPTTYADGDAKHLLPRQCEWANNQWNCDDNLPSVKQIVDRMHTPSQQGLVNAVRSAVFYSELGGFIGGPSKWIMGWLKSAKVEYYWVLTGVDLTKSGWYMAQKAFIAKNQKDPKYEALWGANALATFSQCWYQALSVAAVNPDAYIFAPKGAKFKATSVWSIVEFPYLTQNPNIKRIWRVDPQPPEEGGTSCGTLADRELYWDRDGGDEEVLTPWSCPVKDPAP